jgi:hypothetical protein
MPVDVLWGRKSGKEHTTKSEEKQGKGWRQENPKKEKNKGHQKQQKKKPQQIGKKKESPRSVATVGGGEAFFVFLLRRARTVATAPWPRCRARVDVVFK